MKIGFLYAGQGSQHVGMGKDLYDNYPEFAEVFDNLELDFDVKKCCFEGPIEQLGQTRYTQPCMVAFAVGVTKILQSKGIKPEIAAGLSLGEYSALYASGVFDEKQVIDLVAYRGKSMEEAVTGRDTGMIAVMSLDRETIKECCKQAEEEFADSPYHIAEVANYNTPVQVTVSGDTPVITRAGELMMEKGARRIVPVAVSGPFHTSLMKPAGDKLAERFKNEHFGEMNFPVLFNATGKELEPGKTIPEMLELQVQSSVYFEDSIKYMIEQGVDTFVEIGPGKTLSGFVKKIDRALTTYSGEDMDSLNATLTALGAI
ncbi:MAG: ACP S-malonyltransferase [Lachnospiraceae bacterium]|nr:ACP S-malonyltransferase [Lachnospiraceae bacterium]